MKKRAETERSRLKGDRGFTLIEVVAVLVIMAIIMAVAMSRGIGSDDAKMLAEFNTLKGHLRYAQYLAINMNRGNDSTISEGSTVEWGINIIGNSYALVMNVDGSARNHSLSLPGESSATHNFAAGVTATVSGTNPIRFDDWGSPGTAPASISIGGRTITITANTGFIP